MDRVLTIIMAGGEGTRLSVLANRRAKPAVPFGGIYRIIDFTMSNAMHSGVRSLGVITQYRPYSLSDHIGLGEAWGLWGFGRKAKILSPHTGARDSAFYANTADAIYHNIEFIERFPHCTEVLILSGDHIYKMDYRPMVEQHRARRADLTLATQEVPWEETSRFGIMVTDEAGRISQFQEKPKSNPLSNKASLGIYVFTRKTLIDALRNDQMDPQSTHDFGGDIIPMLIRDGQVFDYAFEDYWRDVGTISSYVSASMEALDPNSGLDLEGWGVRTNHLEIALGQQYPSLLLENARVRRSLISKGACIHGEVIDCVLSPGVQIGRGARVERSILLHGVTVGEGSVLRDVIADKYAVFGDRVEIGSPALGDNPNENQPHLLKTGTSVIGKGAKLADGIRMGRNCLVYPGVVLQASGNGAPIASGTTFLSIHE